MSQQPLDAAQLVYPTVIAWPEGFDQARMIELVASTGAMDEPTARMSVNRQPPLILGCVDPVQATAIVDTVLRAGGDAFAPSMASIVALGASLKVRDLRIVNGNLEVDIWRGMTTQIRREHVQFLVRASIKQSAESDRARRIASRVSDVVSDQSRFVAYGRGARWAAQRHIDRLRDQAHGSTRVSEMLDIHASNGTVFQIDGDKFAYSILGEMKGHADKPNMDALCDLLAHVSPKEVVDNYFPLFRPPIRHELLLRLVPEMRRNEEDASFAFYSRWTALIYRHVMGLSRS